MIPPMTFKQPFEVRDPEVEAKLRQIGEALRDSCAKVPGYGFALLIFQFGDGGNMFWTSNADRDDMIEAMEEFIRKNRKH